MKWFKHFADNNRGKSMEHLYETMGHKGPCAYWWLVEMCVEKLEKPTDREVTIDDCCFTFHSRTVRDTLRLSATNVSRLLHECATFGLLEFHVDGAFIKIKMPILLEWLDYDSKKPRPRRDRGANESRLDTDTDKDKYNNKKNFDLNSPDTDWLLEAELCFTACRLFDTSQNAEAKEWLGKQRCEYLDLIGGLKYVRTLKKNAYEVRGLSKLIKAMWEAKQERESIIDQSEAKEGA